MNSGPAKTSLNLTFYPVTAKRWPDLERLFGKAGACGGCWCMLWRVTASEFEKQKGAGNKRAMKRLVESGEVPGLLAYAGNEPIGWCAAAPRETYGRLGRSRILKPIDDQPVWSITCFFIKKEDRRRGVSVALLEAVVDHAAREGALVVEGYPVDPAGAYADAFAHIGLASAFRRAGFKEVARRSPTRPVMRIST